MNRKSLHRKLSRGAVRTVALGSGVVVLAGCQFGGLNSLNMPGTAGHGAGSYSITVEVPDVASMPQNSPVMIDDVTVGSVSGVDAVQRPDGTFFAAVKLSLDKNVKLPANSKAGWPRRRCWVRSTSTWFGRRPASRRSDSFRTDPRSRWRTAAASPPQRKCCPRSASW